MPPFSCGSYRQGVSVEVAVLRRFAVAQFLIVLTLSGLTGCAGNPLVLKGQLDQSQQQQLAAAKQRDDLQNRASTLDRDNQELIARVTKEQQHAKAVDDELRLVRGQLSGTAAQLARLREDKKAGDQRVQTLTASLQRQGGATITPNSSLPQSALTINLPDVYTRRDGDVIRVELPSHRLFEPGNAKLLPGANQMIATAAAEILRAYPDQIIGVEGNTDSDPVRSATWRNQHHLSLGQALAVYDVLLTQARIPPQQLFIAGHGPNHPIYSNGSEAGKRRNARVELVVYPETVQKGS
jgi:flagellar motor protein MotB